MTTLDEMLQEEQQSRGALLVASLGLCWPPNFSIRLSTPDEVGEEDADGYQLTIFAGVVIFAVKMVFEVAEE